MQFTVHCKELGFVMNGVMSTVHSGQLPLKALQKMVHYNLFMKAPLKELRIKKNWSTAYCSRQIPIQNGTSLITVK